MNVTNGKNTELYNATDKETSFNVNCQYPVQVSIGANTYWEYNIGASQIQTLSSLGAQDFYLHILLCISVFMQCLVAGRLINQNKLSCEMAQQCHSMGYGGSIMHQSDAKEWEVDTEGGGSLASENA